MSKRKVRGYWNITIQLIVENLGISPVYMSSVVWCFWKLSRVIVFGFLLFGCLAWAWRAWDLRNYLGRFMGLCRTFGGKDKLNFRLIGPLGILGSFLRTLFGKTLTMECLSGGSVGLRGGL